ncbi:MAG: CHRD domain-containing protein [Capsulimonadales bacterium]|nr:CHRD domain-containing protein [Capsulimonadales bacterium]
MRSLSRAALVLFALAGFATAGHAHTALYRAILSGLNQSPVNTSPAIGNAFITMDLDLITLRVNVAFSGLTGTVTGASLHAPTAVPFDGTAIIATQAPSLTGFPLGVSSGVYDQTFDLTVAESYNPAFITASGGTVSDALNALDNAIENGQAYFSLRTTAFPDGEVRGFLVDVSAAPEPGTLALLGTLAVVAPLSRFRRKRAAA